MIIKIKNPLYCIDSLICYSKINQFNIKIVMQKQEVKQTLTYVYSNKIKGGRQLELFPDHTFKFDDQNYSSSSDVDQYNWGQHIYIYGSWEYNSKNKLLTLTAKKWEGTSEGKPIQQQALNTAFKQRIVQTKDFQFDNKQVNCFIADWSYDKFESLTVNVLKSSLQHNTKAYLPPAHHIQKKQQKKHEHQQKQGGKHHKKKKH